MLTITLYWNVIRAAYQLPLFFIGKRASFLCLMFILYILEQSLEITNASAMHGVKKLNALVFHENGSTGPVLIHDIDGKKYFAELKDVFSWNIFGTF